MSTPKSMEVDTTITVNSSLRSVGVLKRSNSAPMINLTVTSSNKYEHRVEDISFSHLFASTNMAVQTATSCGNVKCHMPSAKMTHRVHQIKHEEESMTNREVAHEKEFQNCWQMSHSWDGLSLTNSTRRDPRRRPRSISESLHIMTAPSMLCGSLSPTRVTKQCFSPSMCVPVKDTTFTPSPSPSPTQKTFIRSLSPIATQSTSVKRKFDIDWDNHCHDFLNQPKKFHTGSQTPEPGLQHPLAHHSISSSRLVDDHSTTGHCPSTSLLSMSTCSSSQPPVQAISDSFTQSCIVAGNSASRPLPASNSDDIHMDVAVVDPFRASTGSVTSDTV